MMRMCEMSNQGGRQVIRSCERKRRGITDSTLTDKICPYVQLGNRGQENQQQNDHYQYHWNITKIHAVFTLIPIIEPDPKLQFQILNFVIGWRTSFLVRSLFPRFMMNIVKYVFLTNPAFRQYKIMENIKCRTPSLHGTLATHFLSHFFSSAIESYIHEGDFTLQLVWNWHSQAVATADCHIQPYL